MVSAIVLAGTIVLAGWHASASQADEEVGFPVLAYYYIWYTPTSWDRAKTDLPLLGRYSSDETTVMQAHAQQAKSAGIDGFLVSWKHTPDLDRRLGLMAEVARDNDLTLGIVYQGLDLFRRPLPPARVRADLRWLLDRYGDDPVFSVQGRPLIIWSGTWELKPRQIQRVTRQIRRRSNVLASQRSAEEYDAVAPYVDGNAYYWSSLDPEVDIHAQERLDQLSDTVHASGGLWIPSVAPGFDARLVGGHRVVERRDGATLREEWRMAVKSSPDLVGILSWNEFSENSHVEPSTRRGNQTLRTLASILSATVPAAISADSSEPAGAVDFPIRPLALMVVAFGIVGGSLATLTRRRLRARRNGAVPPDLDHRDAPDRAPHTRDDEWGNRLW
jgi:hypothetical protein